MRISFGGYTRIVVVTSHNAYKIARIHPFSLLFRIVMFFVSRKKREKFTTRVEGELKKGAAGELNAAFFNGIEANRTEYRYYQDTHDLRVAPTTKMLLFGLVVVQDAGVPISPKEFSNPLQKGEKLEGYEEVSGCHQFGLKDSKILLLDYGQPATCEFLRKLSC